MPENSTPVEPIRFAFNERKATAAAAFVLKLAGGKMDRVHLLKYLYHADRESLDKLGYPISGDRWASMHRGPILSEVYNLIKRTPRLKTTGDWEGSIKPKGNECVLVKEPDLGPLSPAEVTILSEVFSRYPNVWAAYHDSHRYKEHRDPGSSSLPIEPIEVLRILGKSDEEIEAVRQRAREVAHFDAIFTV